MLVTHGPSVIGLMMILLTMMLLVPLVLIFGPHTHIILVALMATPVYHHVVALEMILVVHVVWEI